MSNNLNIEALRKDYQQLDLHEDTVLVDPFQQFIHWFKQANPEENLEANGMTLATVNADGQPSARTVLLKEVTPEGFVFYTNYSSRKGNDIQDNDLVALLFWWSPLERQVRIEGKIKKYDTAASLAYFQSRPRESQIGAWASVQSAILPNRQFLEDKVKEVEQRFKGQDVLPKPDSWGGYLVQPHRFEFWQGRPNRLHDRLSFSKSVTGDWTLQRLSP